MPVNTTHPEYDRFSPRWRRIRDVVDGEDAVKARGQLYLPKPEAQTEEEYSGFLLRTLFYPATGRTLTGLTGAIFRKEPIVNAPAAVEAVAEHLTPTGTPFIPFAKRVVHEVVALGRYGVLVDIPVEGGDPFVVGYAAENIINWRTTLIDGKPVLTLVVLAEPELVPTDDDPFVLELRQRWRVLSLGQTKETGEALVYVQQVFELTEENKGGQKDDFILRSTVVPNRREETLDFIPFVFFGPVDLTPDVQLPPLGDVATVNLSHYRTSASREEGLYFTGLPVYVISGAPLNSGETPTELVVGSRRAWLLEVGATAQVLTVSSEGMSGLAESMHDKEKLMAVLGARLLEDQKAGVEAAEAISLRHRGENSLLASIADTVGRGLSRVLDYVAFWLGIKEFSTVELNQDFVAAGLSGQEIVQLVAAWQNGGIGADVLYHNLKAGEALPDGMTRDEYLADVEQNGPDSKMFDEDAVGEPGTGEPMEDDIKFPDVLTINEKRKIDGNKPIPEGDAIFIETSKTPALEFEGETPADEEEG